MTTSFFNFQFSIRKSVNSLFECGNLGLCVALLVLLVLHNGRGSICHKPLIGELAHNGAEEALEDVIAVFNGMGMHCLFCPHSTGETLEQAAMVHGNDVDTLVEQLNEVYLEK